MTTLWFPIINEIKPASSVEPHTLAVSGDDIERVVVLEVVYP